MRNMHSNTIRICMSVCVCVRWHFVLYKVLSCIMLPSFCIHVHVFVTSVQFNAKFYNLMCFNRITLHRLHN